MTDRAEIICKKLNMHTYDVNHEYTKKSLTKGVPSFDRYICRPPNAKQLITPDHYEFKDYERAFNNQSQVKRPKVVKFKAQKARDDLLYRQESLVERIYKNDQRLLYKQSQNPRAKSTFDLSLKSMI